MRHLVIQYAIKIIVQTDVIDYHQFGILFSYNVNISPEPPIIHVYIGISGDFYLHAVGLDLFLAEL